MPDEIQPDQTPAHEVWVELATRITTQRLHYCSGEEETAAKSVVDLFKRTRELMTEHPQARAFCALAEQMLNVTIRPHTARWHGWMVDGKFPDEPRRRFFRAELHELRRKLRVYHDAFADMARGTQADVPENCARRAEAAAAVKGDTEHAALRDLGGNVIAGIGTQISIPDETIAAINTAEAAEINARRALLAGKPAAKGAVTDAIGLALSGGGIRSATYSLGIVQVLAQRGLLHEVDYLSTVSGGGYLGSFLSCYLNDRAAAVAPDAKLDGANVKAKVAEAFEPTPNGREAAAMRHLRNSSKYLRGDSALVRFAMAALVVFGIALNFIIILPAIALAAYTCRALRDCLWDPAVWTDGDWWSDASIICQVVKWTGLAFGLVLLCLPMFQKSAWRQSEENGVARFAKKLEAVAITIALILVAALALSVIPLLFRGYAALKNSGDKAFGTWLETLGLAGSGALPVLLGWAIPALKSRLPSFSKLLMPLLALSGPLFYIAAFLFIGHRIGLAGGEPWKPWLVLSLSLAFIVWAWGSLNVNAFSPHRPYRNRLCECYLARWLPSPPAAPATKCTSGEATTQRNNNAIATRRALKLTALGETHAAPYHLICAAVNLPSSREKNLRGRDADFYLFSKKFCGSPIVGYSPTADIERLDPHLDLGTAMAVSGAAASSIMGDKFQSLRFVMTLLNVRLGYWLPNPLSLRTSLFGPGPLYLLREMFGRADERCRYVNASDGGHIENLAIYELLRRRCKFIIAVDGAQDAGRTCEELRRLHRFASTDLGVRIEIDVADLLPDEKGISRSHAVLGRIHYYDKADGTARLAADFDRGKMGDQIGWLLYFKLGVTTAEPAYVRDYQRMYPDFPHQSTGDQIFEEAQFESYRALGETAVQSMLRPEILEVLGDDSRPENPELPGDDARKFGMRKWFTALATNLLPDNAR